MTIKSNQIQFLLLQLGVFFVFIGRAWQHWFYDAPYRELIWDEYKMKGIIENVFGISWTEWVTNPAYDTGIATFIDGMGVFYLLCGLAVWSIKRFPKISRGFLYMGAFNLFILAGLYFKAKQYHVGQLIEYSLQFFGPVLLIIFAKEGRLTDRLVLLFKIAIALTFFGHGLYALGYYPRPLTFLEMCGNILNLYDRGATHFLFTAGVLDMIICVLIFIPNRKLILAGLTYAVLWGLATAIARPWAYFHIEFWQDSLHRWLYEASYRLIHGIGPFVLFLFYWNRKSESEKIPNVTK